MKKVLIVYYSLANGNTYQIARQLQQAVGGDLVRLETVQPYTGSYDDIVAQGQREVDEGYCPEITISSLSLTDYDVIALGTPTWWYTMAPAMRSFLVQHDFQGKTVIPFSTNGGWPGQVNQDVARLAKGAASRCPLAVTFDVAGTGTIEQSTPALTEWLRQVKDVVTASAL